MSLQNSSFLNPAPRPDHTRFIVGCVSLLGGFAGVLGAFLLWKGYNGGGELVMTVNTAIAGLIGFLSNSRKETLSATQTGSTLQLENEVQSPSPTQTK